MKDVVRLFADAAAPRLLVLGDLMLDRYTWGNAAKVSPEAPVVVLHAGQCDVRLGGAASVAGLLSHLDARVCLYGTIGNDGDGHTLVSLLEDAGIDAEGVLVDQRRVTTAKDRFMGRAAGRHVHQILRVDHEEATPISSATQRRIDQLIQQRLPNAGALVISDYAKGVCRPRMMRRLIDCAREQNVPVIVDPPLGRSFTPYQRASVITPNRRETELATGMGLDSIDAAVSAGRKLINKHSFGAVMITLDRDGVMLVDSTGARHFPTNVRDVYDITGAGDTVLAAVAYCMAGKLPLADAATVANVAAGLQIATLGITPIARAGIIAELRAQAGGLGKTLCRESLASRLAECRRQHRRIVFTNGCFDLLHVGHVRYLQEAKQLGGLLVVAVNTDASVRRLKGPDRPVIKEHDRMALLAALECVDFVIPFDEDTPCDLLRALRPDVLVKGGTHTIDQVVGHEIVRGYGGQVCVTELVEGVSTTAILNSLRGASVGPTQPAKTL